MHVQLIPGFGRIREDRKPGYPEFRIDKVISEFGEWPIFSRSGPFKLYGHSFK
jgi:hypothetical protein